MNFQAIFLTSLAVAAALVTSKPVIKLGSLPQGQACSTPMECMEPLYCLKSDDGDFKCAKMSCRKDDKCRIGQLCRGSLCEVKTCTEDSKCPGQTVCRSNGKCSSKSNVDESCIRNEECWSLKCKDGKCRKKGNLVTRNLRRLTGGGIAAIVVGILLLIGIIVLILFCVCRVKSRRANK